MDQGTRPRFIVECTSTRSEDGILIWNGRVLDLSIPGWSRLGLKSIMTGDYLQLHLHLPGHMTPLRSLWLPYDGSMSRALVWILILMDADDQLRLSQFVTQHVGVGSFTTDRKDQIIITECS